MPRLSKLSRSVAGKIVIVTGAASGMGRATANLFADEGAYVAVTDLDLSKVKIVVEEIVSAGGNWTSRMLAIDKRLFPASSLVGEGSIS